MTVQLGEKGGEPVERDPRAWTIGAAALIIMAGNLTTSAAGFVRQAAITHTFGSDAHTDAFVAASVVPQMFYDLTIGAAVSAALIPTFTEIVESRGRDALARTSGAVLGLAWVVLALVIAALMLAAHPLMSALLWAGRADLKPGELPQSVTLVRVLLPSLFFLGTSAVLLATLYSVRRFTAPAFATVFFHVGIIAGAVLLARPLGIVALPVGALVGAAFQAAVQVPALLRAGIRPRLRLSLTPQIRAILKLYAPVAAGLLVSILGQGIDLNFKSQLQSGAITWMYVATTLTQFPIGIAVAALSFAVLPSLSSDAAFRRMSDFKDTLALGIRLVLFLTIPAAIGYLVLGVPVVRLLFQHGHFGSADTMHTAEALAGYAPQIPFVGLDQLLIFAFYARKNTVTPMLVGVLGVAIYVVSGLLLLPRLHVFGLAFANTLQNSLHGLILLALLLLSVGAFGGRGILSSVLRTCASGAVMALVGGLTLVLLQPGSSPGLLAELADLLIPTLTAVGAYLGVAALVGSAELRTVAGMARRFRR